MAGSSNNTSLARIERALARIEAVAHRPVRDDAVRYAQLRNRTQAALASLETVIAKVAGEARR